MEDKKEGQKRPKDVQLARTKYGKKQANSEIQ